MWLCAGATPRVCEAAKFVLQGVQGTLRQYGAVYGERCGRFSLSQGVGNLCAVSQGLKGQDIGFLKER